MNFQVGQEVIMFVKKGAGIISEEHHVIEDIAKGVISLKDSDKEFDSKGNHLSTNTFFGFNFWIE